MSYRTLLRYPGGKRRAIDALLEHLPEDCTRLVSPFLGGGSFELACEARGVFVDGSDIFEPLVNFWSCALDDAKGLADRVESSFPFDRAKFRKLRRTYRAIADPVDRAAAFFLLNRCSYSGLTFGGGISNDHLEKLSDRTKDLRGFSAPRISVDLLDFEDAIARAPADAVIYCDPPYMLGSGQNVLYGENGSTHHTFDHFRLMRVLRSTDRRWLLSYNDSVDVRHFYRDFEIRTPQWAYGMSSAKGLRSREVLVVNL